MVLGCTHYPLLTGVISYVVGDGVTLVSSAEETAKDVYRELATRGAFSDDHAVPRHRFLATGDPEPFERLGRRFLGPEVGEVASCTKAVGMEPVKVTVIGMSGTFPGPHSGCSSYLVEHDGFRLLLDIGNGSIGALQDACGLLGPDAVAISHLHGDHYLDLITYTYARRYHPDGAPPKLAVHGPSTVRKAVEGAYVTNVSELLDEVYDFQPVAEAGTRQIGPFEVEFILVNHPVETYAMRVSADGRTVAYSADTGQCERSSTSRATSTSSCARRHTSRGTRTRRTST